MFARSLVVLRLRFDVPQREGIHLALAILDFDDALRWMSLCAGREPRLPTSCPKTHKWKGKSISVHGNSLLMPR